MNNETTTRDRLSIALLSFLRGSTFLFTGIAAVHWPQPAGLIGEIFGATLLPEAVVGRELPVLGVAAAASTVIDGHPFRPGGMLK